MAHFEIDHLRLVIESKVWVSNQHLIGILLAKLIKRGKNNEFAAEFLATAFEDESSQQLLEPVITRNTLQTLVNSEFWINDQKLLWFIYDNLIRVTNGNFRNFGSPAFWDAIFGETNMEQFGGGNVSDYYEISQVSRIRVKRFSCEANSYEIRFKNIDQSNNVAQLLENIFDDILKNVLDMDSGTKFRVGIDIHHPALGKRVLLPFVPPKEMNGTRILNKIETVQQSAQDFEMDDGLEMRVVIVDGPQGSGSSRWKNARSKIVNWDQWFNKHCGNGGCFIQIHNADKLCMARAIVVAKAQIEKPENWDAIRKGYCIQREEAIKLMVNAGIAHKINQDCGIDELQKVQEFLAPDYQVKVFSKNNFGQLVWQGEQASKILHLYHLDNHYIVITRMPAFIGRNYFCETCNRGYSTLGEHLCLRGKCSGCNAKDQCQKEAWTRCNNCNRWFASATCLANHKSGRLSKGNKAKHVQSVCEKLKRCKTCNQLIKLNKQRKHKCFQFYCHTCRMVVDKEGHECFIKTINEDDKKPRQAKFIFFDLETRQDEEMKANQWGSVNKHIPNCCVAYRVCESCIPKGIGSCDECGGSNRHIFLGNSCLENFGHWLFSPENKGFTVMAHNARGFDSQFILDYLHSQRTLPPSIVSKGLEIMMLEAGDVRIIDTLNFLPMPLSAFPKTFGLSELKKGYFPHFFNTKENWDYIGPLPEAEFYGSDDMKEDARNDFLAWHSKEVDSGKTFNFQKELLSYCESDVDILMKGALKFREIFIKETGVDPFLTSLTIASACNYVFRRNFLQEDTIGIIPHGGYRRQENQSIIALKWLKWVSHKENIQIRHKLNGGEVRIRPYKVDGLCDNTVYEFHGCWWHGCPICMKNRKEPALDYQSTAEEAYQATIDRRTFFEQKGYTVIEKWECSLRQELKRNKEMKEFFDQVQINAPLGPREAFYGGRTNVIKLFHKCDKNERIDYVDVCSLYPWVCKMGLFPIKHPLIITENFENINKRPYMGIVKCTVLPPRGLFHPVLPYRSGGKLLFPLCRSCIEEHLEDCNHTVAETSLTGTWVTLELYKAVDLGYKVIKIQEVWHYQETSQYDPETKTGGLFAEYINKFLRLKQQADGWPVNVTTEEEKDLYIEKYEEKEGIRYQILW